MSFDCWWGGRCEWGIPAAQWSDSQREPPRIRTVGAARLVSNHEAHRLTQENLDLYGQCPYTDDQEVIDNGGESEAY